MSKAIVGVIGGSGLYSMDGLTEKEEVTVITPFGCPSDSITLATLSGVRLAFLPRHGRKHHVTPTEVNYRANIWALKSLGVKYLVSVTAVGSLVQDLAPGSLALVTQLIDKTYARQATFFGKGVVGHVPFGHPTCKKFCDVVRKAASEGAFPGVTVHSSATLVTMEGPAFSTQAESLANRQIGGHLIGMTSATESKLAREAEMAHLIIGLVTDYDSWSEDHDNVDVAMVMETMKRNSINAQHVIKEIVGRLAKDGGMFESEAHSALKTAIMSKKDDIPTETRISLDAIMGKYWV